MSGNQTSYADYLRGLSPEDLQKVLSVAPNEQANPTLQVPTPVQSTPVSPTPIGTIEPVQSTQVQSIPVGEIPPVQSTPPDQYRALIDKYENPIQPVKPGEVGGLKNAIDANRSEIQESMENESKTLRESEDELSGLSGDRKTEFERERDKIFQIQSNFEEKQKEFEDRRKRTNSRRDAAEARLDQPAASKTGWQKTMEIMALLLSGSDSGLGRIAPALIGLTQQNLVKDLSDRQEAERILKQSDVDLDQLYDGQKFDVDIANQLIGQNLSIQSHYLNEYARSVDDVTRRNAIEHQASELDRARVGISLEAQSQEMRARAAAQNAAFKNRYENLTPPEMKRLYDAGLLPTPIANKYLEHLKKEKDLREGDVKVQADQRKDDSLVAGAQEAYNRLFPLAFNPDGKPKEFQEHGDNETDLPNPTIQKWTPDIMQFENDIQMRADQNLMLGAIIRKETGAQANPSEIDDKREAYGLDSGDEAVRLKGIQSMFNQFRAIDQNALKRLGNGLPSKPEPAKSAPPDPRLNPGFKPKK